MSHITIIISRAPPHGTDVQPDDEQVTAEITFTPPDAMSEQEVAQNVRRLYRQIRNLGNADENPGG
jgi:hypothetical protein